MKLVYLYFIVSPTSIVWASTIIAVALLRHISDYYALLLERHEPLGVPSPCGHSCMVCVCATVCLTVMPSFSDITDVSTIGHNLKTDSRRNQLFFVAPYGDDFLSRELNLDEKCPVPSVVGVEPTTLAATDGDKTVVLR